MNFRYPIFLDLTGKKCLVIGEGPEIRAKLQALRHAGARVEWRPRDFNRDDLSDCFLVITNLPDNSEVFCLCEERHIICNSIDDPSHCRFSFGSVHSDGDLTIAIATNGVAPALAVRLREQLEREIGPEYGYLLAILKEVRAEITSRIADFSARRDLWYGIVDSDVLESLRAGQIDAAKQKVRDLIEHAVSSISRSDTCAGGADQ